MIDAMISVPSFQERRPEAWAKALDLTSDDKLAEYGLSPDDGCVKGVRENAAIVEIGLHKAVDEFSDKMQKFQFEVVTTTSPRQTASVAGSAVHGRDGGT